MIDENNKVQTRQISVAQEMPHVYIVSKGLTVNDKILLEGLRKVKNNEQIHYDFVNPQQVLLELSHLHAE